MYDAFGAKESQNIKPGVSLFTPVETPFGKIGLLVCYELRFPEIARYQALHGADLLVVPSGWVKGP
ncbi:nitrilase-related carbon-nitrogen hydrolase, partial [Burkholderia sp. SIMBA_043]|uniref:nitrilase-related carbon-nitrogen hydrolase n=1 Tax=Burkholderia sp. SIMBA_043 TaxID=3085784 RepID=UPI00397A2448